MTRQLVVVDIETSALGANAVPLEIAAVNVDTGEEFYMVPFITTAQLAAAEPKALQINRYFERGVFEDMLTAEETKGGYLWLTEMLRGNTFAGSNPTFDSQIIAKSSEVVWHHRLADLAAYTAGQTGIDPADLPGLAKACELLGVINAREHSALGDAVATAECFRRLRAGRARVIA